MAVQTEFQERTAGAEANPQAPADTSLTPAGFDLFHTIVFPNNIRHLRRVRGHRKLLGLAPMVAQIPYVRLSKIERGEVVARVEELVQIAAALEVDARELLIDVGDPDFEISAWASEQIDLDQLDVREEEFAVLLGAALRHRRAADRSLTPAFLESTHGLPPAIVSRLENALKPLSRWNPPVQAALCAIFDVPDVRRLEDHVRALHAEGALDPFLSDIRNPQQRIQRTIQSVNGLIAALSSLGATRPNGASLISLARAAGGQGQSAPASAQAERITPSTPVGAPLAAGPRMVPVHGSALAEGLVARTLTNEMVEIPASAGPNAWAMRVCWQSLGAGMPGRAVVVVDPDRFPSTGGLAVVRDGQGFRLLAVKTDRQGRLHGYSDYPERDIVIDQLPPADVGTVIGAVFE